MFRVLTAGFSLAGLVLGAYFGFQRYGWIGSMIGLFAGAYVGLVVGRLQRVVVTYALRNYKKDR